MRLRAFVSTVSALLLLCVAIGFAVTVSIAAEPAVIMAEAASKTSASKRSVRDPSTRPLRHGRYDILPSAVQRAEEARGRRVRRWRWRDPSLVRGLLWNVPDVETTETLVNGQQRTCIAEAFWDNERDCIGIWQVIRVIRNESCNRERVTEITECYEDGSGETHLSAMRRAQKIVMGMVPPRISRQRWIRNVELDCEEPEHYEEWRRERPSRRAPWPDVRDECLRTAELARQLVTGERHARVTGRAVPITWGGTMDDYIACGRRLARIPNTGTHNTFWCRPGARGCARRPADCRDLDDAQTPAESLEDIVTDILAVDEHGSSMAPGA